jgi:hypothetical protein
MTSKIHTANKSNKPLAAKYSPLQQEAITYGSKFVTTRERERERETIEEEGRSRGVREEGGRGVKAH